MANVVRDRVEGIGISNNIPDPGPYFKEICIPEIVTLPEAKPNMEQLISVMVDAKIVSVRVINTPTGTSKEGQHLNGRKLSVELELQQKVKYVADEPTQSVHAAHFNKLVNSIFIVVDSEINGVPVEKLILQGKYRITPYIEDIFGEQLDKRTIFKNITLLVAVKFLAC